MDKTNTAWSLVSIAWEHAGECFRNAEELMRGGGDVVWANRAMRHRGAALKRAEAARAPEKPGGCIKARNEAKRAESEAVVAVDAIAWYMDAHCKASYLVVAMPLRDAAILSRGSASDLADRVMSL